MSNKPLNLALIQQRLQDQVPALLEVGGAADLAVLEDLKRIRTPSAFVLPGKEKGSNDRATRVCQVMAGFGVVVAVRHYGDIHGEKAREAVRDQVGAVRDALIGWKPTPREFQEVFWLEGDVMSYDDKVLLWLDAYQTSFFMTGASS